MMRLLYAGILFFICTIEASELNQPCSVHCQTTDKKKPVCASDRQSYPSKCEVRRQRICFGKKNLEWVHEGECLKARKKADKSKDLLSVYGLPKQVEEVKENSRNCTAKRMEALEESQKLANKRPGSPSVNGTDVIMVPRCKQDGSYEEVQCHPSTGYCWCVQPDTGAPIPQTSMQYSRPNCGSDGGDVDSDCSESDRTLFNTNLLAKFKIEYDSISPADQKKYTTGYENIQGMPEENAKVAAWRFNSLDRNGDMELTMHEMKDMKRVVRKNVKPKACSKIFLPSCDKNSDAVITFQEYNFCLGGSTHCKKPGDQLSWNGKELPIQDESQSSESKDGKNPPELMEHQKKLFDMLSGDPGNRDKDDSSNKLRSADQYGGNDRIDRSPNDRPVEQLVSLSTKTCMDERESALAKKDDQTFVPRCQQDGRYEPAQCHSFSGYCWCVDPESGLPISGTSRLKEEPECENMSPQRITDGLITNSHNVIRISGGKLGGKKKNKNRKKRREIPGCPSPNHGAFLTQLVDLLAMEMASAGDLPAELTNSANMSLEEKAVRWKAITSDRNKDKKLSKKEMRFVRHMVKEKLIKAPEKCAKKFIKYCDTDRDDYVSVEELLICTEVRRKNRRNQRKQGSGDNIRHSNNRNPFTDLLKPSS